MDLGVRSLGGVFYSGDFGLQGVYRQRRELMRILGGFVAAFFVRLVGSLDGLTILGSLWECRGLGT